MDVATHYPPLLFTGCRQLLVTDALLESCLERQHEVSGQLEAAEAGLEQLQERVVRVLGGRGIAEDALKRTQSSLRHYRSRTRSHHQELASRQRQRICCGEGSA